MRQQGFEEDERGEEPWKLKPAAAGCGREGEIATTAFNKTSGGVGSVCTVEETQVRAAKTVRADPAQGGQKGGASTARMENVEREEEGGCEAV